MILILMFISLLAPKASEAIFVKGFSVVTVVCVLVVTVMERAIGGLPKCPKFIRIGDTFGGCWLLLILMMTSTQKYIQLII